MIQSVRHKKSTIVIVLVFSIILTLAASSYALSHPSDNILRRFSGIEELESFLKVSLLDQTSSSREAHGWALLLWRAT